MSQYFKQVENGDTNNNFRIKDYKNLKIKYIWDIDLHEFKNFEYINRKQFKNIDLDYLKKMDINSIKKLHE